MKITLELFGASRDLSNSDHLEIEVQDKASVEDLRNEIIKFINKNKQLMEKNSKFKKSRKLEN